MKAKLFVVILGIIVLLSSCTNQSARTVIVLPKDASAQEELAAKEVRRYIYQRTGELFTIIFSNSIISGSDIILVSQKKRPIIKSLDDKNVSRLISKLKKEEYVLKTIKSNGNNIVLLCGGDETGILYAAYRFAEHLGIRFYLHGDVIPDEKVIFQLPQLDEIYRPLFAVRGILPFHDFPEGPDWWNADDYKAVLSQLPKLGMNFIGLHTYPESNVGPEPTVWIGMEKDIQNNGDVSFSYPARYFTTVNGTWGYKAKNTSDYYFSAGQLFTRNAFGAEYMKGMAPWSKTSEEHNMLFNRTGNLFNDVFTYANKIGIKTCVGTQTPLHIPGKVKKHLIKSGKNPQDIKTVQALYEGMFQWVAKNYPIDYYWLWTPENWTWGGNTEEDIQHTRHNINAAVAAMGKVKPSFTLATSGWVLGPKKDRTMFDGYLQKEMPMSSINRQMGIAPVDVNFARIKNRPKWAIPWLEDDAALVIPQLWAGRMRRDAADALSYGCTGLIGIHWRTRILAPNISALANAGWEQKAWNPNIDKTFQVPDINTIEGSPGALFAVFTDTTVSSSKGDSIYRTLIYSMDNYYLNLGNGVYDVTLKFLEVHYKEKNKRYFGVKIQNKIVEQRLDIYAHAGYGKPLELTYNNIKVTNGRLHIQFKKILDNAILAGIVIAKSNKSGEKQIVRKINCAGRQIDNYEMDPSVALQGFDKPRDLPVNDFYSDWALVQFGKEAAKPMADLFTRLDGSSSVKNIGQREANLSRPANWLGGPGGIFPDPRPWNEVKKDYDFINEMEQVRTKVKGAGNLERFDYWLDQFYYLRAVGKFRCTLDRFNRAMKKVRAEEDINLRKKLTIKSVLPIRREQIAEMNEINKYLMNSISTTGGLGTIANWQQHNIPMLIENPGRELAEILGEELSPELIPAENYLGNERMIVPTIRSVLELDEPFRLKIIFFGERPESANIYWRNLGKGEYQKINLDHVARNVYSITVSPNLIHGDFEYYIKAVSGTGKKLFFPATAPGLNQAVVVMRQNQGSD